MIQSNTAPPERPLPNRAKSRPANELLPRVLEVLPVGAALFELDAQGFRFRYGNQVFARVLALDRMPADGQLVGEVFSRAEHDAVIELFRLVRASREPQSHFTAERGQRQDPPPDVAGKLRVRPGLSRSAVPRLQARGPAPTRRGGRTNRE